MRSAMWQALAEAGRSGQLDLLIIGGGITGAGIARDATLRGLKVALVEKADFAAGTSSKSSKLIHGGLRYLQQAELGLVFESVSERTKLLGLAPHLVRPLLFLAPAYKGKYPGRIMLQCGLTLYDALSKFSAPGRHRTYRTRRLLEREPMLNPEKLTGGVTYYDCITDDVRLTVENIVEARELGALALSYARVTGFLTDDNGTITGAEVKDVRLGNEGGETIEVRAKVTVNASGPWSDLVLRLLSRDQPAPLLRPTKGAHVVVDAARLPVKHAVVMTSPRDERVLFAIPWEDSANPAASRTIIGTTDTDYHGDPDKVAADRADVEYLLSCANWYFPTAKLVPDDVISTWAGLRPLVMPNAEGMSASDVSREHRILRRPGLLTIVGGKLTTYRRMAGQVVEAAFEELEKPCPPSPTEDRPLIGTRDLETVQGRRRKSSASFDPVDSIALALRAIRIPGASPSEASGNEAPPGAAPDSPIDLQVANHLAHQYGMRALRIVDHYAKRLPEDPQAFERLDAELPYLYCEVDVAVREDGALQLEDVLERRLQVLLRARDQGLGCVDRVVARMAPLLGWSAAESARQAASYRELVAETRRFRSG